MSNIADAERNAEAAYKQAEAEVVRLMTEIDQLAETITDKREAERRIVRELVPAMEAALAKSRTCQRAWMSLIKR